MSVNSNISLHLSNSQLVLSNLVLHLSFVLLQVSKSLLQINVLLPLRCHCLVEELGVVLDDWHHLLQVVIVKRFELPLHRGNLRPVCFDKFFVLFQLRLSGIQHLLQVVHVGLHVQFLGRTRTWHFVVRDQSVGVTA